MRVTGTIKWFDATKKYGFITRDNHHPDVFLHIRAWWDEGTPQTGQRVSFEVVDDRKGLKAGRCARIGHGFDIVTYGHGGGEYQLFVEQFLAEKNPKVLERVQGSSVSFPGGYVSYKLALEPGTVERAWEKYRAATFREKLRRQMEHLQALGLKVRSGDIADGIGGRDQDWCEATISMIPKAIDDPRVVKLAQDLGGEFHLFDDGWGFSTYADSGENETKALDLAELLGGCACSLVIIGSGGPAIYITSRGAADPVFGQVALVRGQKSARILVKEAVQAKWEEIDVDPALASALATCNEAKEALVRHLNNKPPEPSPLEKIVDTTEGWFASVVIRDWTGEAVYGGWVPRDTKPLGWAPGRQKMISRHPNPGVADYEACEGALYRLLGHIEVARAMLRGSPYYLETPESQSWLARAKELVKALEEAYKPVWQACAALFPKGWGEELCRARGILSRAAMDIEYVVFEELHGSGNQGAVKEWRTGQIQHPHEWVKSHANWERVGSQSEGLPTPDELDLRVQEWKARKDAEASEQAFWRDLIATLNRVTGLEWDDQDWWTSNIVVTGETVPVLAAFVGEVKVAEAEVWYTKRGGDPYYRLWQNQISVPEGYTPGSLEWRVVDRAPASRD